MRDRSCARWRDALRDYSADRLTADDARRLERHLASCANCRRSLAEWRAIAATVSETHGAIQPPPFAAEASWRAVRARIAVAGSQTDVRGWNHMRTDDTPRLDQAPAPDDLALPDERRPRRAFIPLAAALVVVVVAAALIGIRNHQESGKKIGVPGPTMIYVTSQDLNSSFVAGQLVTFEITAIHARTGQIAWRYDGVYSSVLSYAPPAPVVAGNAVYIMTDDATDPRYLTGYLTALDATDGAFLWKHQIGFGVADASCAIANGVVFVRSYDAALGAHALIALDARTGSLLWKQGIGGFGDHLTVVGGVVYDGVSVPNGYALEPGYDLKIPSDLTNFVYALRASDGAVLWHASVGEPLLSVTTPLVANGFVYTPASLPGSPYAVEGIAALDARDGSQRWSFVTNDPPTLTLVGSTLVVVANGPPSCLAACTTDPSPHRTGALYALDANSGAMLWGKTNNSGQYALLATGLGLLYVADGSWITAYRARGGAMLWLLPATSESFQGLGYDQGSVFVMLAQIGADNSPMPPITIAAYDAQSGRPLWQKSDPNAADLTARIDQAIGGTLYVDGFISNNAPVNATVAASTVTAISEQSGATMWEAGVNYTLVAITPGE